ncbi:MAG TPA: class I SAM-dependent methyltransferase [Steroidobacteraceae bacterium]
MSHKRFGLAVCMAGLALTAGLVIAQVPYVRSPENVVKRMLEVARVNERDIVYDLGSGDGRIVIMAAKRYGARGVGIDIDPERIAESNANAQKAGVADRVRFIEQDLFDADISEATVVTMYLVPHINLKLRPKLFAELRPGTRVVSHNYDMGDWKPQRVERVGTHTIYYWVIPPKDSQ